MNGTHLSCPSTVHGSGHGKLKKKKNWAALTHERYPFKLSEYRSWLRPWKVEKKKNWAALTHERYPFKLSEYRSWLRPWKVEKKKKLGSTDP